MSASRQVKPRRSMIPLLGILDDADRPEAAMLVVLHGSPWRPRVAYVNPARRGLGRRGHLAAYPPRLTPLDRFGRAAIRLKGALGRRRTGPSTARYPDGALRRWQGRARETVAVRAGVELQIAAALAALTTVAAVPKSAEATSALPARGEGHGL